MGTMRTPGGSRRADSSSRTGCSLARTSLGFSQRRMSTMPSTPTVRPSARSRANTPVWGSADLHAPDVPDVNRHATRGVQHDVLDVLGGADEAGAADGERLLAHVEQGAAGVAVVAL